MRHLRYRVQERVGQRVEQRRHGVGRGIGVLGGVAPHDAADLAQVQALGEGLGRGHGAVHEEAVHLAGCPRQEVTVGGEDFGALFGGPEGGARDDRAQLVQPEEEGGDDAEVAAASADRPVQVGAFSSALARTWRPSARTRSA